jgi:hypothetical protein
MKIKQFFLMLKTYLNRIRFIPPQPQYKKKKTFLSVQRIRFSFNKWKAKMMFKLDKFSDSFQNLLVKIIKLILNIDMGPVLLYLVLVLVFAEVKTKLIMFAGAFGLYYFYNDLKEYILLLRK